MTHISTSTAFAFAVAAALSASAGSVHAAGRFAFVEGPVSVQEGSGAARPARAGERVNAGDTISTGNGRAQVRFDDRGWVFLQPSTVFEVKEYSEKESNVALSLLKGSLRAVSGLIGDRNPSRFRVETAVATIGIRGTSFQATFCAQSCNVPDGLYVTGGDGTTFVRNPLGEIDLALGRTGYVASLATPPRESNVKPVAEVTPMVTPAQMANAGSTNPSELRPGNFVYFEGSPFTPPFTVRPITTAGGGLAVSGFGSATATILLRGTETIRSESIKDTGIAAGAGMVIPGEKLTVTLDAAQRPVNLTGSSGSDLVSVTALTAPELAFSDNILFWGRWTNAKFFVNVQSPHEQFSAFGTLNVPAGSFVHYIFGIPSASVPLSGTATYSLIGGTGSTALGGTVGAGLTGGTLTANFAGSGSVTANNLVISHGGTYTVSSAFAPLTPGNRAQFANTTGSASGPGGSFPFRFEGFFAGAAAPVAPPRAGMVWTIERPDAIVGAAAFRCSSGC